MSRCREPAKVLEPGGRPYMLLISQQTGYERRLAAEALDASRFEGLLQLGRHALVAGQHACSILVSPLSLPDWQRWPVG